MRTDPLPSVAADLLRQTLEHLAAPAVLIKGGAVEDSIVLANAAARERGIVEADDESPVDATTVIDALRPPKAEHDALLAAISERHAALLSWTDDRANTITVRVTPLDNPTEANDTVSLVTWSMPPTATASVDTKTQHAQRELHDWLANTPVTRTNLHGVVRDLTSRLCDIYDVERASVWLFSDDDSMLNCLDRYQRAEQEHHSGDTLRMEDCQQEFETLRHSTFVDVHDTATDPRARGYLDDYLIPNRITSMLDAVIRFGGRTYGTICLEHVDKQHVWQQREIDFACTMASYLATALESLARRDAESLAQERERFLSALVHGSPVAIQVFAPDGTSMQRNAAMDKLLGLTKSFDDADEYNILRDPAAVRTGRDRPFRDALAGKASSIERSKIDFSHADYQQWPLRRDTFWVESVYFPVCGHGSSVEAVVMMSWEVTERVVAEQDNERLDAQLRQSQKLEAVGMLAGGVAHDFNNILTAVIGFTDMLAMQMQTTDSRSELVTQVRKAADRGAALTKQLLTFGRVHMARVEVFDASTATVEMMPMLRRLLEANIQVDISATASTPIEADRGQYQQVMLNLLVNARDAMLEGGKVTVTVDATSDDEMRLTVRDTGSGMDEETLARIFEPFFTTKGAGRGTGLGLSTVYGIVSEAGGRIEADSAVGKGSTFRIYWPLAKNVSTTQRPQAVSTTADNAGHELVLVVEDDDANRTLAAKVLRHNGYRVLSAATGEVALELAAKHEEIDVLLTDVVMPGIGGRALAEQLIQDRPDLRVVFTSGYTSDDVLRHGVREDMVHFLPKPYSVDQLAHIVRHALDD